MPTKDDFVNTLMGADYGIIFVCNVLDALDAKLMSRWYTKRVFKAVFDEYCKLDADPDEHTSTAARLIILFHEIAPTIRKSSSLTSQRGFSRPASESKLATTVTYDTFYKYYAKPNTSPLWKGKWPLPAAGRTDPRMVTLLKKKEDAFIVKSKGTLGQPGKAVWVTEWDSLNRWASADDTRDVLGLIQYEKDTCLVTMSFSFGSLDNSDMQRPTVLDGGNERFRTIPDTASADKTPNWGYTVDLGTLAAGGVNLNGINEAVAESTPLNQCQPYKWRLLGFTEATRGLEKGVDDDAEYLSTIRQSRSDTYIKDYLLRLL